MIEEQEYEESGESSQEKNPLDHPWSCGSDGFSMLIAEGTIDKDCPIIKNRVNNCCFGHDNCYDDQKGRKYCDDVFCDCLSNVTVGYKTCHEEDSPVFCDLVRELGESAYIASGPNGAHSDQSETAILTNLSDLAADLNSTDYGSGSSEDLSIKLKD
ncbi:hypothetical protein FO519_004361 [Halicephalobus sp. NKZ332]|nr:hypothetical protein FO519_004361 [Halicephalobus sp. NKZ332]